MSPWRWTILALAALVPFPAFASEYTCPSDPGFCYFDVGNDGCFDMGVDTGPIDGDLEAGTFPAVGPPSPGSIVCPPDAGNLNVPAIVSWETAGGGSILLHGTKVIGSGGPISITSGAELVLGGKVSNTNSLLLEAQGDVKVRGSLLLDFINAGLTVRSVAGSLSVGPRVKIKGGDMHFEADGDITLLDRVQLQRKSQNGSNLVFTTPSELSATSLGVTGAGTLSLDVGTLRLLGRTKTKLFRVVVTAMGDVEIDQIKAIQKTSGGPAGFEIDSDGGSVEIGRPDANGKVRPSTINVRGGIVLTASENVRVDRAKMLVPGGLAGGNRELTAGGNVALTDSLVRGQVSQPRDTILTAGAGSSCDITDSKFLGTNLILNCDTVTGP